MGGGGGGPAFMQFEIVREFAVFWLFRIEGGNHKLFVMVHCLGGITDSFL